MNIFYHLIIILFIIFKFNISIANEISCFEFKEIIKNNAAIFYDPPAKDETNDYGIYFDGYDEGNYFVFDVVCRGCTFVRGQLRWLQSFRRT